MIGTGSAVLLIVASVTACSISINAGDSTPSLLPAAATTAPQLQPPAAPTGLAEWIVLSDNSGDVPAYFKWTPPAGPISGYYFHVQGVYADETPPPAICGPTWTALSATATTYVMPSVQAEPQAYLCAFNEAGTSPTVRFPIVQAP